MLSNKMDFSYCAIWDSFCKSSHIYNLTKQPKNYFKVHRNSSQKYIDAQFIDSDTTKNAGMVRC